MDLTKFTIPTAEAVPGMTVRELFAECVKADVAGLPFRAANGKFVGKASIRHVLKEVCIPQAMIEHARLLGDSIEALRLSLNKEQSLLDLTIDDYVLYNAAFISPASPLAKALATMESLQDDLRLRDRCGAQLLRHAGYRLAGTLPAEPKSLNAVETHGDISSMWIATAILIGAYAMIFSERLHRTYAALAGAVAMVGIGGWLGFYSQDSSAVGDRRQHDCVTARNDAAGCALLRSTGLFEYLAIRLAKASGGSPVRLMVYLGVTVSVLSMILDNVTTVIIFAPLTIPRYASAAAEPGAIPDRTGYAVEHRRRCNPGWRPAEYHDWQRRQHRLSHLPDQHGATRRGALDSLGAAAPVLLSQGTVDPDGSDSALIDLDENKAVRDRSLAAPHAGGHGSGRYPVFRAPPLRLTTRLSSA